MLTNNVDKHYNVEPSQDEDHILVLNFSEAVMKNYTTASKRAYARLAQEFWKHRGGISGLRTE